MAGPLDGVKVLDFTTLLPGPMTSLILAEAGAEAPSPDVAEAAMISEGFATECGSSSFFTSSWFSVFSSSPTSASSTRSVKGGTDAVSSSSWQAWAPRSGRPKRRNGVGSGLANLSTSSFAWGTN